jgi:hypothetical protein
MRRDSAGRVGFYLLTTPQIVTIIIVTMVGRQKYKLIYAPVTKGHLKFIDRKYYPLIRFSIEKKLQYDPDIEIKNRKPLKRQIDFGAEWELRFGPDNRFRVFYEIDLRFHEIHILAIGEKIKDHLFVGGEEIRL